MKLVSRNSNYLFQFTQVGKGGELNVAGIRYEPFNSNMSHFKDYAAVARVFISQIWLLHSIKLVFFVYDNVEPALTLLWSDGEKTICKYLNSIRAHTIRKCFDSFLQNGSMSFKRFFKGFFLIGQKVLLLKFQYESRLQGHIVVFCLWRYVSTWSSSDMTVLCQAEVPIFKPVQTLIHINL